MPKDFGSSSDSRDTFKSDIGRPGGRSSSSEVQGPLRPVSPPILEDKLEVQGPLRPVSPPTCGDESRPLHDRPGPVRKLSLGSKVPLDWLAGKKVRALRISADGSRIQEFTFNGNEHWRYTAVKSDQQRAILTRKHTELDIRNPLASDYLRHHSDAAKDPKSRASLNDLHGEVIVLGYDRFWEKPTQLSEFQVSELEKTLKWMDPTISVERIQEP